MTLRPRPLAVCGALLVLAVLIPLASRADDSAVSLRVQSETGWWGREDSGPGAGLAQRPASEWRFTLMPTVSLWGYDISGRLYLTSLDDALSQARNRLQLQLHGERFGVAVGDNFNTSNRLVAQGARIRGATAYARPNSQYSANVFYGQTMRSVEGVFDTTANRVTRFGTYERRVLNVNVESKPIPALTIGGSVATGEDRERSIQVGRQPRSVTAIGGAVRYAFPRHNAEIGFTAGRSETEITATDFDSTTVERDPAWAWHADARVALARQHLSASYYTINTFYESFAAPTLIADREGFELKDQTTILQDRCRLEAGYQQFHDNVEDIDSVTLTVSRPFGAATLMLRPVVDQLRLTGGYRVSDNDLQEGRARRVERNTTDWGITASRRFTTTPRSQFGLTAGWTQSDVEDRVNETAGYTRSGGRVGFDGRFSAYNPLITLTHYTTSYDAAGRPKQKQLTGSATHRVLIDKTWELTADQRYSNTKVGSMTTGERVEVGGAVMRYLANRKLTLAASYHYIDYNSDTAPNTDFQSHSMFIRLATVGAIDILSID